MYLRFTLFVYLKLPKAYLQGLPKACLKGLLKAYMDLLTYLLSLPTELAIFQS